MGELPYKIKELCKSGFVNDHWCVLCVEKNAVLIVINIGRILEAPLLAADGHRDNAVILSCGVIESACIAYIFGTQQTLRISALLCILCGGNSLRVFFGLGEIYCYIKLAVFRNGFPFDVLLYSVAADIIGVTAHFIVNVRCLAGRLSIILPEFVDDLRGTGSETSHKLCVKKVTVCNAVGNYLLLAGKVQQTCQYILQRHFIY